MKTIRTILATFGVTSLVYGLFALIAMRLNPAFTGRSIFQLFRETGFVALVIGIGCVLSFVIMTIAIASFRDEGARKKRDSYEESDDEEFLEEETVPEELAEEADETWSQEIKRKQRRALQHADEENEEPLPDLFGDDDDEPEEPPMQGEPADREEPEEAPMFIRSDNWANPLSTEPEPEETSAEPSDEWEPVPEETDQEAPIETEEPEADFAHTKFCRYCGNRIDADSAFCIYCGKRA